MIEKRKVNFKIFVSGFGNSDQIINENGVYNINLEINKNNSLPHVSNIQDILNVADNGYESFQEVSFSDFCYLKSNEEINGIINDFTLKFIDFLSKCTKLTLIELNLNDLNNIHMTKETIVKLADTIAKLSSLHELTLKIRELDHNDEIESMSSFLNLLKSGTIKKLYIEIFSSGVDKEKDIEPIIADFIDKNQQLKELEINGCGFRYLPYEKIAKALENNTVLKCFRLPTSSAKLGGDIRKDPSVLLEAFEINSTLEELYFFDANKNMIPRETLVQIRLKQLFDACMKFALCCSKFDSGTFHKNALQDIFLVFLRLNESHAKTFIREDFKRNTLSLYGQTLFWKTANTLKYQLFIQDKIHQYFSMKACDIKINPNENFSFIISLEKDGGNVLNERSKHLLRLINYCPKATLLNENGVYLIEFEKENKADLEEFLRDLGFESLDRQKILELLGFESCNNDNEEIKTLPSNLSCIL